MEGAVEGGVVTWHSEGAVRHGHGVVTAAPYTLPTDSVTFHPAPHGCGSPYVSFEVAAGDGAAASTAFNEVVIAVAGVADRPVVDPIPGPIVVEAGAHVVVTVTARDGDILSECLSDEFGNVFSGDHGWLWFQRR